MTNNSFKDRVGAETEFVGSIHVIFVFYFCIWDRGWRLYWGWNKSSEVDCRSVQRTTTPEVKASK
ncbi:hypothetical protein BpHYR1_015160 [Brachionus plicatilis]|uniref:Uncharacterized protein n=1 Tax=Brachionus plicatilis TaxID=10195 RepID=A0A3M7Q622_BRAPC|nr:hypothetical protein BpHYR1_015160 [Brachionus plicatilis]